LVILGVLGGLKFLRAKARLHETRNPHPKGWGYNDKNPEGRRTGLDSDDIIIAGNRS
jgi:hypothetical protein